MAFHNADETSEHRILLLLLTIPHVMVLFPWTFLLMNWLNVAILSSGGVVGIGELPWWKTEQF